MPDDPIVEPAVEPAPVVAPEPVVAPVAVAEPPEPPALVWEVPRPADPSPEPIPAATKAEVDEWEQGLTNRIGGSIMQQNAQFTAGLLNNQQQIQTFGNKKGYTDEVIQNAQAVLMSWGPNAAHPDAARQALAISVGNADLLGQTALKPKPIVTAPGAAPVGNIPPMGGGVDPDEAARAAAAFNAAAAAEGIKVQFAPEDFGG